MLEVKQLTETMSVGKACNILGVPRANYYRHQQDKADKKLQTKSVVSSLELKAREKQVILDVLHEERFVDKAPLEIFTILLDEGFYYCSVSTMYRILRANGECKDRRRQRRTGNYKKPELLATAPNQVWSWDITKLRGPVKWSYFYLYVIMDIFSRYVVGWMIADRESASLAKQLVTETSKKQGICEGQLTLHADRGASMKSKALGQLLADLGITKTHSRPYTSNDNPFSESQFKTLKYRPQFPGQFGSIQDAKSFCREFFEWYNNEHRHSGINMLAPKMLHYGQAEDVLRKRTQVLQQAYLQHPNRFKYKLPNAGKVPEAAWINKPCDLNTEEQS